VAFRRRQQREGPPPRPPRPLGDLPVGLELDPENAAPWVAFYGELVARMSYGRESVLAISGASSFGTDPVLVVVGEETLWWWMMYPPPDRHELRDLPSRYFYSERVSSENGGGATVIYGLDGPSDGLPDSFSISHKLDFEESVVVHPFKRVRNPFLFGVLRDAWETAQSTAERNE